MKPLPPASLLFKNCSEPSFLKGAHKRNLKAKQATEAQIVKGPVMKPVAFDPIEQYDYFASTQDAILDHWNAPQDLPDVEAPNDRRRLTKIHDTRRKAVLGLKHTHSDGKLPTKRMKAEDSE